MFANDIQPTGRIVVLAEMNDGTIRAFDGYGSAEINIKQDFWEDDILCPGPLRPRSRTTTMTIEWRDKVLFYHAQQPKRPDAEEIEERKQIE